MECNIIWRWQSPIASDMTSFIWEDCWADAEQRKSLKFPMTCDGTGAELYRFVRSSGTDSSYLKGKSIEFVVMDIHLNVKPISESGNMGRERKVDAAVRTVPTGAFW